MLYVPDQAEVPRHCVESVLDIRRRLSDELQGGESGVADHLRAMRRACRKFLAVVERDPLPGRADYGGEWPNRWVFNSALGELRGVFGVQIAQLAAQHGLDIEDDLAKILPAGEEGDRELDERRIHLLQPPDGVD